MPCCLSALSYRFAPTSVGANGKIAPGHKVLRPLRFRCPDRLKSYHILVAVTVSKLMNEPSSADLPDNGNKLQSFDDIVRVKAANQIIAGEATSSLVRDMGGVEPN